MTPAPDLAIMPGGRRIRLSPGAHASPGEGVCVVELASVIADEEFGDRPRCVCPVIGAFLRGLNDRAPHAERQRLIPYAPRIVGSRADRAITGRRRDLCLEWVGADLRGGLVRRLASRVAMRVRIAIFCGFDAAVRPSEGAGDYAARVARARGDEDAAFELLERLLAIGAPPVPEPGHGVNGNGAVNGHGRPVRAALPLIAAGKPETKRAPTSPSRARS